MYSKRFLSFILIFLLVTTFVFAQGLDKTQEDIDKAAKDLEEGVDKFRDLQKPDSWTFIFSQWKEFLLKNKLVSGVDSFFTKINIVFLVLFGMSWDLTPQMFFAFLFWVFTFLSINRYMSNLNSGLISWFYSLIFIVVMAQTNFFEYFGKWMVSMIFYKDSILYQISFFFVALIFIIVWFGAHLGLAKYIDKHKKDSDEKRFKRSIKNTEDTVNVLAEAKARESLKS